MTVYNPWSNDIIERVHQSFRDNIATFELSNRELPEYDSFGSFLSTAAWAIKSTIHTSLQATPGQLVVFGRDMFLLNIPFRANWVSIWKQKQGRFDWGVLHANWSRVPHQYCVGDAVLYQTPGIVPKMQQPWTGLHMVTQVYMNDTIRIQRGSVEETIDIQNVTPYFKWMNVVCLSVPCVEENVIKGPFVHMYASYDCRVHTRSSLEMTIVLKWLLALTDISRLYFKITKDPFCLPHLNRIRW
jgi:hypothetical protein